MKEEIGQVGLKWGTSVEVAEAKNHPQTVLGKPQTPCIELKRPWETIKKLLLEK